MHKKLTAGLVLLLGIGLSLAGAAEPADAVVADLQNTAVRTQTDLNILWVLMAAFLVFFMQAGFALVETGFTRAKNVSHTMMMNLMVFCIGALGYWLTGFAFQFGNINFTWPAVGAWSAWAHSPTTLGDWSGLLKTPLLALGQHGLLGGSGFLLSGLDGRTGILVFFIFQMFFMDTAATIPTGSMAERLKFSGFCFMGLWISMLVYPAVGNWIWGGGWLQNLGRSLGLGHGAVDFAGSGVVHMTGGAVAFAGALAIGPRIGRFNPDGSANAMPGHNIPMGILGTIILFFGWFGFNPGSSLALSGSGGALAATAAINTLLAGASGGCSAMLYMWWFGPSKKPDPALAVNGVLAGLVAITAPCAFVGAGAAVLIGAVAGLLVCLATWALEKMHVDDPVGAIPVHFVNGAWGLLAVGLFSCGLPSSDGWNGVAGPVRGLFYGHGSQLLAQVAEIGSIILLAFGGSLLFFKALSAMHLLRSLPADELAGLDLPEMGLPGYTNDDVVLHGGRLKLQTPSLLVSSYSERSGV